MPVLINLRWKGHSSADAATQYEIQSDVATPNIYVALITRAATAPYAPVSTTLNGTIVAGATSLTMANATNFANNDVVSINREVFILADKVGSSFNNISGGQYNTIPQDHPNGSFIYKMHETYVPNLDYGSRHVIRFHIVAIFGTVRLVAAEAVAVQPSLPSTNDKITIWGIQDKLDGTPQAGVNVTMTVAPKAFSPGTAETLDTTSLPAVTDASGYWQITTTKDVAKSSGGAIGLNIGGVAYTLKTLPDVDTINYLECI